MNTIWDVYQYIYIYMGWIPYGMNTVLEYLEAKKRGEGRSFLPDQIGDGSGSGTQIE